LCPHQISQAIGQLQANCGQITVRATYHINSRGNMPVLFYASASPYSAKVRMAAAQAGVSLNAKIIDPNTDPAELIEKNPLGKLPTLVTDDGEVVYDSRVITQYLNRLVRNSLFPTNPAKRLEAEKLEALADGITDSLLAHVYERRYRPEEKVQQSWLDRQMAKALRGLDALGAKPPRIPNKITAGHIAMRCMLGYADLRFKGQWERGRSKLVRWAGKFDDKFPELASLLPK
jgi:glutathione S-transferase